MSTQVTAVTPNTPTQPVRVSIVVLSYNYERFLPQAIDSALRQTHPVEVLVVDDGSTDGSHDIIRSYGDRVRAVFKANGGNSSVVNAAVPLTTGDVVMFLDADDVLADDAAQEVAAAWQAGCSKVQFRLSLIDTEGRSVGVDPPWHLAMPTGDVVPEILARGSYVTPVTTGNAFSRGVLDQLLPIPERDFRNTNDGYLNPLCPFYGPVISVDQVLGSYRLHGSNIWAYSSGIDLPRLRNRLVHAVTLQRYLADTARARDLSLEADVMHDPVHVLHRLISLRLDPAGHPVPGDRVGRLLRAGIRAVVRSAGMDPVQRGIVAVALPFAVALPTSRLQRLTEVVFPSRPRAAWLRRGARVIRSAGAVPRRLRSWAAPRGRSAQKQELAPRGRS